MTASAASTVRTAAKTAPKGTVGGQPDSTKRTVAKKATPAKADEVFSENPLAYLLDKAPSELHANYRTWLEAQMGTKLTEQDLKMIQIVCVSRMDFQRSDANQTHLTGRKAEWAKAQTAKQELAKVAKAARLAKLAAELGVEIKSA